MIKLNLLPKTLRRRVEPGWWRLAAIGFAGLTLGIVAYLYFSTLSQRNALQREQEQLQIEVNSLQRFIAEQRRLEAQRTELQQVIAIKAQLDQSKVNWSDYLAAVINQIPRSSSAPSGSAFGVNLKSIGTKLLTPSEVQNAAQSGAYDGKSARVEFDLRGEALNERELIRFVDAFESSPRFGINFRDTSLDQQRGVYTFSAIIGLVDNTPAPQPAPSSGTAAPQGSTGGGGQGAR